MNVFTPRETGQTPPDWDGNYPVVARKPSGAYAVLNNDPIWLTTNTYIYNTKASGCNHKGLCSLDCDTAGDCKYNPQPPKDEPVALDDLSLPDDDAVRGDYPMFDGLVAYFPNALAEVSKVSKIGNDQHNPGQPMHWARDKSTDHENKIMRHLVDAGKFDGRGVRHTARLAWRALAMLQEEIERAEGICPSRASTDRPW